MRLSELKSGESATIIKVLGHGGFRRRILEMGFVRGKQVEVILNAPLKDPVDFRIMESDVSLRRSEADMIEVISNSEAQKLIETEDFTAQDADDVEGVIEKKKRHIKVALIGNPNAGKTSLFNALSGSFEHVGNYSGVTVAAKQGVCKHKGYTIDITDLPGTYALSAYTPEERYVRQHLVDNMPDVVLNVVAASNIERNLYLTTELIDMNPRMVVALNMYDEVTSSGRKLDYDNLGRMMGVPMVTTSAVRKKGITELLDCIISTYENNDDRVRHIHINQGAVIEESMHRVGSLLRPYRRELPKQFPPRYMVMKLIEGDEIVENMLSKLPNFTQLKEQAAIEKQRITQLMDEDVESAFANRKYGFIAGALGETYTPSPSEKRDTTAIIDKVVTHKLWGFPIFLAIMWLMFYTTFHLGSHPAEWIELAIDWLSTTIDTYMSDGILKDLIVDGIIGGVGSVIVFLPNIMILYLFLSFMEDSGYLARAAFIMDRIMHGMGVHGKSFIPMVMGFGCNVPAIMATRTIESRSSRLITIMVLPFMSCSARLPVYILITSTFFAANASTMIFFIYTFGIAMAFITARLMRKFLFKVDETPFVMELPPYRLPTLKNTMIQMWDKCTQYLHKMSGMILVASIVIWFLSNFPQNHTEQSIAKQQESSYLAMVGKGLEPVFEPLGFNWKANVAILSGAAAKEVVVTTMGVLYSDDSDHNDTDASIEKLPARLSASNDLSTSSAIAFMIFIVLYFPCVAAIAAIKNEAGWLMAVLSIIYSTTLAWVMAFAVYQLVNIFH